ncbi:polymerase [Bradyrhizobium macuxiense]|uniref:Porin n=1 Tax=Bradyrhizobium macuxiense TaxID=1755647 RepID=A0A109JMU0_9BRAD|nr:porin [Bradyrhizobium macuxiense]KWV51768.1 polymerase [Bradyrhizobium macuxiense]
MNMVKSLILGSAAALVAVGGAQAADLPVKAKAIEYVKVCSLYGPGFYYIPGTDTCIKLGGYLRVDVLANTNSDDTGNTSGAGAAGNRFTNGYTWRSREDLNVDTRTATEYGVVRTFFDATFSWTTDSYAGAGNGSTIYSPIGTTQAPNNANAGAVAGGTVGVYYAFIQFAGFTIGKAVSQFSTPWANYPGNSYDGLVGGGGTITGVNQFTYTADFGNGTSLSLSAQDQTQYYQAGVQNLGVLTSPYGASDYAGTIAPDLVAMLRVDQAWGLFQASFAAHDNHAAYFGGSELTGHPDDKWGWAGQLALSIKNIPTGPGDTINVQGVYTNGASRYNIQDLAGSAGANTIFGHTNLPGAYQSIGFGIAPDSVFIPGGQQQLVTTYGMRGAYVHNWSPNWNTSIYGAWAQVNYNSTAKTYICGASGTGVDGTWGAVFGAAGVAGMTSCNPNYSIAQLGTQTQWTPVKNLTFSADFTYTHLDQNYAGTLAFPGTASIGKPAAVYELKNQDTFLLLLRAQRNW